MEIKEITDKAIWENFCLVANEKTFTHSYNWGIFNEKMGDKIWRMGAYDADLAAVLLVIKITARRGTYLLVPMGPIIKRVAIKKI